ncbi:Glycosyl hydrolase, BNR repeat protein [Shewanella piezotolerans WP3]|uniref:Glycosyl hydrolase, BNR repeat protein n=1 Tax=Shewanella piezotolerans (strain WP3 / JCM 13877) TaxID=225849 RepID=B8CRW4_SHEPW|nr:Ig-like domain-containing protein [Shewanella piezotolerans]ACJ30122.1 Glycosyl hydrolase, BNR repeat protein [Shewanella piezotolerans WP3]
MSKLLLPVLSLVKQLVGSVLLLLSFFSLSANAATSTILDTDPVDVGPVKSFSLSSANHGSFDFKCTEDADSVSFAALMDCGGGNIAGFYGASEHEPIAGILGLSVYSSDAPRGNPDAIWLVFRQQAGQEFDFTSFSVAVLRDENNRLEVLGLRDDAIVARVEFAINPSTIDDDPSAAGITTVTLPSDFDNVDEVRIRHKATLAPTYPGFYGHQFHNFVINDGPAANTAPTISVDNSTASYTENAAATQIDVAATLSDADGDADWDGGSLQVQITANAEAADEISLSDLDVDGIAITVSGTNILANGTDIADVSVSGAVVTNNTLLTITFNSDATNANVQEVLQSLRYRNTSDNPGTSNRTITFTATDSNSASVNDTRTVSVTAQNDDPLQNGVLPTELSVTEDMISNLDLSAVSISDADAVNTTLKLSVTGGALTAADGAGYSLNITGSGSTTVSIFGTPASINSYLDTATNIKFLGTANANGDGAGVLTLVGNDGGNTGDGGGGDIAFGSINIDISAQNDAPSDIGLSATSINQSATGTGIQVGALSAVDIDSNSFTFSLVADGVSINGSCGAGNDASNNLFQVTGTAFETQSVIAAGSYKVCLQVSDGATNYQKAFSIMVMDNGAPDVTISGASGNINAAFTATFSFSEAVTGFVMSDISASNATVTNFAGSGTTYTALITPTVAGSVTVDVAAGVAKDVADNGNTAATQLSVSYDASQPSIAISGASGNINAAFTATFSFSEVVTGFVMGDISASNATVSNFTGSGTTYTALITPTAAGSVTVDVAADVAKDVADNGNTAATQLNVTYDASQPSITISGASGNINAAFTATFSFSEVVTGFVMTDISASNATVSNFTGSGTTYTALITPTSAGSVTVNVAAGVAKDVADNGNTAAAQLSVSYDASQPSIAISGASGNINAAFMATFSFSEVVTGFVMTDISASNATVSNFTGSGTTYSATITPAAAGSVTVDVAANVAKDVADNGNTAATQLSVTYDASQPSIAISGASGNINAAFTATFSFSEAVTGFVMGDISANNATVTNFTGSGTTYTALITPTSAGSITVNVAAGVAKDVADNGNTAATQLSVTFDASQPSIAISGASGNINAAFTATFSFSEVVTGFVMTDISASNATVSNFTGSGTTYSATITPAAAGSVTVDVAAGVAKDVADNGNTAATQLSVAYDASQPSIAISGASGNINAAFTATFSFSEVVTGFVMTDISASNATVSNFTGSGTTYSATITPAAAGSVTVDVAAGVAKDVADNGNTAATQLSVTFDASQPSVAISGASGNINAAFTATFSFSEAVTGFVMGDISASNATLSNFSGSGASYSALITPSAAGSVTVDVAAGVAKDVADNGNTAATQLSVTFDASQPSIAISGASGNINAAFTATFSFSEVVTGFVMGDISASNATVSNFTGSGTTYTALITPTAAGSVTVDVAADVAKDVADNGNTAATQLSVTYDASQPSITISGASGNINAAFTATFSFSEVVTGFVMGDISVSNATVTNFTGSGTTYTALITPTSAGSVTVNVAAGVAKDVADNGNTVATQLSVTFDASQPSIAISGASGNINAAFTASFTFSESVTGFTSADISVSNASVSNFTGSGASYSALITPTAAGSVTVDVAADVAKDVADNGNTAATQLSVTFDASQPSVAISGASGNINAAFTASFTFSEAVTGFDSADISISNATLSSFSGSGASYSALITPTAAGSVTVDVAADVAKDVADNGNTAATQLSVTYDASQPSVAISGASGNINAAFTASFTFSEAVTGFDSADISISNATLSSFSGSGASYSALITPSAAGSVTVDVAADVAKDVADNGNTAAAQLSVTYDGSQPSVVISGASGNINAAFTATFTFSESVTGFDSADISVSNASVTNFAGSGTTYTALISPTAAGSLTVDVAADVAVDSADNGNTAADAFSVIYDDTPPTVIINGATGDINSAFTANLIFSEEVEGFDLTGVELTNATLSQWSGEGLGYSVLVTPIEQGEVSLLVKENAAADKSGRLSLSSELFKVNFDSVKPEVTLSLLAMEEREEFAIDMLFTEPVIGLTLEDFQIENGIALSLVGEKDKYVLKGSVTSVGQDVLVQVPADVVEDSAENGNLESTNCAYPTNSPGSVRIDGFKVVEQTITAVIDDVDGITEPAASYQWFSHLNEQSSSIGGEDDFYVLTSEEAGKAISVIATYLDDAGRTETVSSELTAMVMTIPEHALALISDFADLDGDAAQLLAQVYLDAGVSNASLEQLDSILTLLNNAVANYHAADIDEVAEIEALIALILQGQDSDGDGIPNLVERDIDTDGDGIADANDTDSDNDGISDAAEFSVSVLLAAEASNSNSKPNAQSSASPALANAALTNVGVIDGDEDGIIDFFDADVDGDNQIDDGRADINFDGVDDNLASLTAVIDLLSEFDLDQDLSANHLDLDSDNDGVADVIEAGLEDADSNGFNDDPSSMINTVEALIDTNSDTKPDFLQLKSNGEVFDLINFGLPLEMDADQDGRLDDTIDMDHDGLIDIVDGAVGAFGSLPDLDGDGYANHADDDDDGDGIPDVDENPQQAFYTGFDADADGIDDGVDHEVNGVIYGSDSDGNGVRDDREMLDTDNDGIADHLDVDSDNDGTNDGEDISNNNGPDGKTIIGGGAMHFVALIVLLMIAMVRQIRVRAVSIIPVFMLATLACVVPAHAQYSIGGGLGAVNLEPTLYIDIDKDNDYDLSYNLELGYGFDDSWWLKLRGVELGQVDLSQNGSLNAEIDYRGVALFGQYQTAIFSDSGLEVYGLAGVSWLETKTSGPLNIDDNSDQQFAAGAGLYYGFNQDNGLAFEWVSYAEDVWVVGLQFTSRFGR